jgi:hypothetical protein
MRISFSLRTGNEYMREVRFEREGTAVLEDDMLEEVLECTRVEVDVLYVVHSAVFGVGGLQE